MIKLTKDEKESLRHALRHLMANHIADEPYDKTRGGWYYGDRDSFIRRHRKAVKLITKLLETEE